MTWNQVGIVSKELLETGWWTNVFPNVTAVLSLQVGFLVHTRQSLKVWLLEACVFPSQNICCYLYENIRIKNCGAYFVYELLGTYYCPTRYCGNGIAGKFLRMFFMLFRMVFSVAGKVKLIVKLIVFFCRKR